MNRAHARINHPSVQRVRASESSYARQLIACYDAWHDVENAQDRDEATASYAAWWQARTALSKAMAS